MLPVAASDLTSAAVGAAESPSAVETMARAGAEPPEQAWNWHAQNTDIVQYHPGFSARYSGVNSLNHANEVRETVSLDLLFGLRLWRGAEIHVDGLMWQGFGLSNARGVEAFPDGEAFRVGTEVPDVTFARALVRQTFGLGGEREAVPEDGLHLAGQQDISRVTLTVGKFSAKDIFDNNAYANDARTQFMSWALMANEAWDYPADALGYMTGMALELNQPKWALRYGFFQMPHVSNGISRDPHYLDAWGMVAEWEGRYSVRDHPGTVRLLAFLNRAHMGSYEGTVDNPALGMDITRDRAYRHKFGFGLNAQQELTKSLGLFTRLGWSDGRNEAWTFADVDWTATLGASVKGEVWKRPNDTVGLAGVMNGISRPHRDFFAAGGTGILGGDGKLRYDWEKSLETYYDFQIWKTVHGALDYQFITNQAYNQDRGPVSVLGARLHWEF